MLNRILVVMILFVTLVAGCGGTPKDQLVGTWHFADAPTSQYEFTADGLVRFSSDTVAPTVVFDYTVIDDSHLQLTPTQEARAIFGFEHGLPLDERFFIQGDTLTIRPLEDTRWPRKPIIVQRGAASQ